MHVCKTVFRSGGHDISTRADSNIRQHYAVGAQTAVQGTALDPYGSFFNLQFLMVTFLAASEVETVALHENRRSKSVGLWSVENASI